MAAAGGGARSSQVWAARATKEADLAGAAAADRVGRGVSAHAEGSRPPGMMVLPGRVPQGRRVASEREREAGRPRERSSAPKSSVRLMSRVVRSPAPEKSAGSVPLSQGPWARQAMSGRSGGRGRGVSDCLRW